MPDRESFLRRVDERLPFITEQRDAVLEELRGHLDESVAGLIDDGWDPVGAEEEALRRMGDPDELARDIGRAQQTRRRLLAAAGAGVVYLGISPFVAVVALLPAAMLLYAVTLALSAAGVAGERALFTSDSTLGLPVVLMLFAWAAGQLVTTAVARNAHRSLAWSRRRVAAVMVPLISVWVVGFLRAPLDPLAVALLLFVPAAAAVGIRQAREGTPLLFTRRGMLSVSAVMVATLVTLGILAPARGWAETPYSWEVVEEPDRLNLGLVGALTDPRVDLTGPSYLWRSSGAQLDPTPVSPKTWADYPTRLLEVWPATDDGFRIHRRATGPLASTAVGPVRPPQEARFAIDILGERLMLFPRPLEPMWRKHPVVGATIPYSQRAEWGPAWAVLVGVAEDGRRQVLQWSPRAEAPRFEGTILEWLLADRSPRPISGG